MKVNYLSAEKIILFNFLSLTAIKEWIKNGKIREFKR